MRSPVASALPAAKMTMTIRHREPRDARAARRAGVAALVLAVLLLGASWPVMKIGLRATSPLWFGSGRLLVAGLLYALVLAVRRRLVWPPRSEWRTIAVLGVFQSALMLGLVTIGVSIIGAGRSAVLAYTMPIWIVPGAALLLHERASRMQLLGVALGVAGIAVLFNPLDFDWSDHRTILGNASVLGAALAWSFALLQVRGHKWRLSPLQIMPHQTLLGGVLLSALALAVEGMPRVHPSMGFVLSFAYVSIFATCVAMWLVVEAAHRLPAIRVSIGQLATPVIGVTASGLWLGEVPTAGVLLGLALILLGVGVSTLRLPRERRQPEAAPTARALH